MSVRPSLFIGGEWIADTGRQFPVTDPFTSGEIARVPMEIAGQNPSISRCS